jgi:peptidoglycan biosynthesis protein MviN/MurJ (putative lipid II flippase)
MGHVGISVAVAGSSAAQMVLLLVGLRRRLGAIGAGGMLRSAVRTLAAAIVASAAAWTAAWVATPHGAVGAIARALPGLAGMTAFTVIFVATARAMHSPELREITDAVRRRMRRREAI